MPHDKNGTEVHVGDLVMVPCRVKAVHLTEDYCNVDLVTAEVMSPSDRPSALTLNSKQTLKLPEPSSTALKAEDIERAFAAGLAAATASLSQPTPTTGETP